MNFRRVILLDLASLGIGESSDANQFDSVGADTLRHAIEQADIPIQVPHLESLGLANIFWQNPLTQFESNEYPNGFFGRIQLASKSNTKITGIREMFDYQAPTRTASVLDSIPRQHPKLSTTIISYFQSYFASQEAAQLVDIDNDVEAFKLLKDQLKIVDSGLLLVRLQALEQAADDGNANQYIASLNDIDLHIGKLLSSLHHNDLVIITSSYANDFTLKGAQPTREYLPLLTYTPNNVSGHALGIRRTLGDIGKALIDIFSIDEDPKYQIHGFLGEMH